MPSLHLPRLVTPASPLHSIPQQEFRIWTLPADGFVRLAGGIHCRDERGLRSALGCGHRPRRGEAAASGAKFSAINAGISHVTSTLKGAREAYKRERASTPWSDRAEGEPLRRSRPSTTEGGFTIKCTCFPSQFGKDTVIRHCSGKSSACTKALYYKVCLCITGMRPAKRTRKSKLDRSDGFLAAVCHCRDKKCHKLKVSPSCDRVVECGMIDIRFCAQAKMQAIATQ